MDFYVTKMQRGHLTLHLQSCDLIKLICLVLLTALLLLPLILNVVQNDELNHGYDSRADSSCAPHTA